MVEISATSGNTGQHDQTASRAAAIAAQQKEIALENQRATPPPQSHGFDAAGNRVNDQGQIVQFAGQQTKESYLADRGYGNTGKVIDQAKAEKADFSSIAGVSSTPTSGPKSYELDINEGVGFGEQLQGGKSSVTSKPSSKSIDLFTRDNTTQNQLIEQQNINTKVDNAFTRLSNKDIRDKNLKNENDLKSFFNKGQEQGAEFSFFVGDKKVGEVSGQKTFYSFLKARKEYGDNVSIQETFPSKEKALTESVQKNTDFFQNLPPSYWKSAGKSGFISQNNAGKINNIIDLNVKTSNRENLALLQGSLFSENRGGEIPTKGGVKVIGPQENEVSSFLKFPFAGQKTSTSFIPSTSYSNILQFAPGLPIVDRLAGPASKIWIDIIDKTGVKAGEFKTQVGNKVRTSIGGKAFESAVQYENPKNKPISLEPRRIREEATFRPTNPMREKLPSDIFIRDTTETREPVSARQNIPRNTMFEDVTKETQNKASSIQRDLLTPRTPDTNPPASRNISFFQGRKDPFGRLFTSNQQPLKPIKPRPTNESINLSGKAAGIAPTSFITEPSTTGLSPISRDYFGVQFTGSYPTSYLPPAAGQIGSQGSRVVESDIFYRPARKTRNIELGFGEQPKESVSVRSELIGSRKNLVKENQTIFLSRTQNDLLVPTKKQETRIIEQKPPEEINILGRRGKPPVKSNNPLDITQKPRAEFVEEGRVKPENEVFTSRGKKLRNEYGDILFGDLTKPEGALRSTSKVKSTRAEVNLEPQKDYQTFRYEKSRSTGPFNFGFRLGKPPKEINLTERKDYQDWRFSKFTEKNPPPEKTGNSQFDTLLKKLPTRNTKSAVMPSSLVTDKDVKVGFLRRSSKLVSKKPKEEQKTTGLELKNVGSKQETVLLQKPQLRRRIVTAQDQQQDYGLEFRPVPRSESATSSILGLKSGVLSGQSFKSSSKQDSRYKLSELLTNLGKTTTEPISRNRGKQFPKQTNRESLLFTSKPIFAQITSPKQNVKPFQTTSLQPKSPNLNKQSQSFKFGYTPQQYTPLITTREKPPKTPKVLIFRWTMPKGGKAKTKTGPTGLINLHVTNIFASTFNINVSRNRRVEL